MRRAYHGQPVCGTALARRAMPLRPLIASGDRRAPIHVSGLIPSSLASPPPRLPVNFSALSPLCVPSLTPEQEHEALYRSYDVPILVRHVDGTARVYRPGEWPPAGGVGEGNRIIATLG